MDREIESNKPGLAKCECNCRRRAIFFIAAIVCFALPAMWFKSPIPAFDRKALSTLIFRASVPEPPVDTETVYKAVVVMHGTTPVTGTVTFEQPVVDGPVTISGTLSNLDPSSLRGFHVHELGNLTDGCTSTGSHFNPYNAVHGAPTDSAWDGKRHVGDLGNVVSDANGVATFSFTDDVISLNGPMSIIGRAMVVHVGQDDLGLGGNPDSLKTGNSGGRAACGVIGRA